MKLLSERLAYIYEQRPELEGERGQIGLTKASGASKSVVNQWMADKIKSMDIKYALNIERALGVSHIWLMTGEGDPWDAPLHGVKGIRSIQVGGEPSTVAIKRMNVTLSAGVVRLEPEYDETYGGDLNIPAEMIAQLHLDPEHLMAMQVKGQSMEPMMFEDDIVVIDISDKKPINREVYALVFDGEAYIKQLLNRGGQWYLHSINADFGPVNVRSGDLKIIGRVVIQPTRVVSGRL